jgi:hypothetical protein
LVLVLPDFLLAMLLELLDLLDFLERLLETVLGYLFLLVHLDHRLVLLVMILGFQ